MAPLFEADIAHFALLVEQWNELPPGEINFDLLPPELKAAWEERAPIIQSILKENGGPCSPGQVLGFFVNDVFVPLSHAWIIIRLLQTNSTNCPIV